MQELSSRKAYPAEVAAQIESMGELAVVIANRWMLGWPDRVQALMKAGIYLESLDSQTAQENGILAKEADLRHLARHEILQMYEIKESPPALE